MRTRAATVASLATSLLLTVGVVVAPQALAAGSADLSAAMNGDDGANVGEGTPFTLEVDNAGPDDTDATATYSVSGAGATIDAASVNGAVCASLSSCAVHVPAFDEVDITLTVTAHTTGDFTVSGSVTGVARPIARRQRVVDHGHRRDGAPDAVAGTDVDTRCG